MIVKEYQDGKLITLNKPFDERSTTLYLIYFIVFFIFATLSLWFLFDTSSFNATLSCLILTVVFYIIAYKYLNKCFRKEEIFANKTVMKIIVRGITKNRTTSYDISKISNFRHLEKPKLTRHPLAGNSFDYFGFETEQQVINEMHGDNRLAFDYEGKVISFGQNIYSWQFEELEMLLYDITGNDFRYNDEYEKSFNK